LAAPTFLRRADAVAHARDQGWAAFRTQLTADETWRATYEPGPPVLDPAVSDTYPGCTHAEVAWVGGETGDEDPHKVAVLVWDVPLDEVAKCVLLELDHTLSRVWCTADGLPRSLCEPHDASRWDVFRPRVAAEAAPAPRAAQAPGDRAAAPRARPATPPAATNRSTAESPTRRVHAIADAMPGATRQEVVAACVAEGINRNTAGTQYFHWSKARQASTAG
jgi:hypothetical protein